MDTPTLAEMAAQVRNLELAQARLEGAASARRAVFDRAWQAAPLLVALASLAIALWGRLATP